ncbi:MAG: glycosyltransferase family 4 protein [Alphaproteobacteria bacterium]
MSKSPRILIITDAWYPQVNGVVTTIEYMKEYLEHSGFEVILETAENYFSIPIPTYKEIRLAFFSYGRFYKKLDAISADYIHIATEGSLGMAARRWALKRGHHYTTAFHTMLPEYIHKRCPFIPLAWLWRWERWFHKNADYCFAPTQSVFKILNDNGFKNTAIWGRGVDTQKFKPAPKSLDYPSPVWLYVGRVAIEKNIEAFLKIPLEGTKLIVGGGPALKELKQKYPKVIFMGMKTKDELVQYYNEADIFVFPSKTDTFGLVMLEALACGKPVAAYPAAGALDIINGHNIGVLSDNLQEACQKARLISPKACRDFAETQSWQKIMDDFIRQMVNIKGE